MKSPVQLQQKQIRVFLSSTFIDLKDHRKSVDDIINRLTKVFSGMEYFGARPFEPKEASFNEIGLSDIFVARVPLTVLEWNEKPCGTCL